VVTSCYILHPLVCPSEDPSLYCDGGGVHWCLGSRINGFLLVWCDSFIPDRREQSSEQEAEVPKKYCSLLLIAGRGAMGRASANVGGTWGR
jgi:hypothetical protein